MNTNSKQNSVDLHFPILIAVVDGKDRPLTTALQTFIISVILERWENKIK